MNVGKYYAVLSLAQMYEFKCLAFFYLLTHLHSNNLALILNKIGFSYIRFFRIKYVDHAMPKSGTL